MELILSLSELDAMRAKALNCAIDAAMRQYLAKHTSKDADLPFESIPGRDNYPADAPIGTIFYEPAPDVQLRLGPVHKGTISHIRQACREFISYRPEPEFIPKPPQKEPEPAIELFMEGKTLAALKADSALKKLSLSDLIADVALAYYASLGSSGPDWRGTGRMPGGDSDDYTTSLHFRPKPSLVRRLPGAISEFISVALERRYSEAYA